MNYRYLGQGHDFFFFRQSRACLNRTGNRGCRKNRAGKNRRKPLRRNIHLNTTTKYIGHALGEARLGAHCDSAGWFNTNPFRGSPRRSLQNWMVLRRDEKKPSAVRPAEVTSKVFGIWLRAVCYDWQWRLYHSMNYICRLRKFEICYIDNIIRKDFIHQYRIFESFVNSCNKRLIMGTIQLLILINDMQPRLYHCSFEMCATWPEISLSFNR